MKKALLLFGGSTLLYLLFRKATDEPTGVPLSPILPSCQDSSPPTKQAIPPSGYRRATALPKGTAAAAQQVLTLTKNIGDSMVLETFPNLLFLSEWHCSDGRWHRGVSVFEKVES
jgi:hypothetical protein